MATLTLLAVSGCAPVARNDPLRIVTGTPDSSSAPTSTPKSTKHYDDMTFEAGQDVPVAAIAQLGDSLGADWSLTGPDAGNGQRSYTRTDGQCEVRFKQGPLDPALVVPGDDRASTDKYLASLFTYTPEQVTAHGGDDSVAYGKPGSTAIANVRVFAGANKDGSHWLTLVRVFASPSVGLYADLSCKQGVGHEKAFAKILEGIHISTD